MALCQLRAASLYHALSSNDINNPPLAQVVKRWTAVRGKGMVQLHLKRAL